MSSKNGRLIGVLLLQILAVILYPPQYLINVPQSGIMPAALILLFIMTFTATNLGVLAPSAGRESLVMIQGLNILVRILLFFPGLNVLAGPWQWLYVICILAGIVLSWYMIIKMEKLLPRKLILKHQ
jgi:hypothetical protein